MLHVGFMAVSMEDVFEGRRARNGLLGMGERLGRRE